MRLFSLILLNVLSSLNSFSQSNPMLGSNAYWSQMGIAFTDNTMQYFPFAIWTDGDTLINDNLYYHFYRGTSELDSYWQKGYIREDSGKVYVRMSEMSISNWCGDGGDFPLMEEPEKRILINVG